MVSTVGRRDEGARTNASLEPTRSGGRVHLAGHDHVRYAAVQNRVEIVQEDHAVGTEARFRDERDLLIRGDTAPGTDQIGSFGDDADLRPVHRMVDDIQRDEGRLFGHD